MSTIELQTQIPSNLNGERLDRALAQIWPEYSRAQFKQWILAGEISVNGTIITLPRQVVYEGESISLTA